MLVRISDGPARSSDGRSEVRALPAELRTRRPGGRASHGRGGPAKQIRQAEVRTDTRREAQPGRFQTAPALGCWSGERDGGPHSERGKPKDEGTGSGPEHLQKPNLQGRISPNLGPPHPSIERGIRRSERCAAQADPARPKFGLVGRKFGGRRPDRTGPKSSDSTGRPNFCQARPGWRLALPNGRVVSPSFGRAGAAGHVRRSGRPRHLSLKGVPPEVGRDAALARLFSQVLWSSDGARILGLARATGGPQAFAQARQLQGGGGRKFGPVRSNFGPTSSPFGRQSPLRRARPSTRMPTRRTGPPKG